MDRALEALSPHSAGATRLCQRGFTVVELLITVLIVGVLAAIAFPTYRYFLDRSKVTTAKADILRFQFALERYYTNMNAYPPNLEKIADPANDPWGNPYRYLPMEGASVGEKRKDKSLHPLNTDYDLYSMGADGKTATPLTARASRDDIVRANNGAYVGLAEDY
jgi:general secretion pathway protein G